MRLAKRSYLRIILILIILLAIFMLWVTDNSSKKDAVESAAISAIANAVESQQNEGDREEISQQGSQPFFSVNFNNQEQQGQVFRKLVYLMNGDPSLPPLKLSNFRMTQTTAIDIHVTVNYVTMFGIHQKVTVHTTAKLIPFKNKTGSETL